MAWDRLYFYIYNNKYFICSFHRKHNSSKYFNHGKLSTYAISCSKFCIFKRKSRPIFAKTFTLPSKKDVDKNLIIGASLFGIGWGLVGLCPGPAISAISFLNINVYLFVLFMFVGFYLGNFIQNRKN